MFNRLALTCASKSLALATAIMAASCVPASAWTSDDTATAATLLDGVLRLFDDVAGAAKQAQAADIEADRRALIASGGCVVTDVQAAIKQVWGRDEAVKRFYGMVNNGAIARNLWTKCRPELRVSTWELSAVQQVVVNVWNADVAEENARTALTNEIAQYDGCVDQHVATAVDQGIRDKLTREEVAVALDKACGPLAHLKSVAREASADAVDRITAYSTTSIERQFNLRVQQANEQKAAAETAMIEVSKTYSQCLEATASQLALVSDEMAAAIFKAANVICADQREAIAGVATKQGLGVAEAMDYAEKRGEEVATAAVILARTKAKASDAESPPPQPQTVKH
ncbi:MAG: hypothetical protein WAN05_25875 [Roseiarcus sp.]|jgi:hypothetical protein